MSFARLTARIRLIRACAGNGAMRGTPPAPGRRQNKVLTDRETRSEPMAEAKKPTLKTKDLAPKKTESVKGGRRIE